MAFEDDLKVIRSELESSDNPLFIFDNDPDGLCSYLQLRMHADKGRGVPVRKSPVVDMSYIRFVDMFKPDKIFILDIAEVEQDFIDSCSAKIVWVDHHEFQQRENVTYINPIRYGLHFPVAYITYMAVKESLWISAVGCVADYHVPDFIDEFSDKYPGLITDKRGTPDDLSHGTKLGVLIDAFSFAIKGIPSDVTKYISALTKIKEPDDILEQKSAAGKFVYRKYKKVRQFFEKMLKEAEESVNDGPVIVCTYSNDDYSITADLSNEVIHNHPDKIVIVARKYEDNYFMSLRSRKIKIRDALHSALEGLEGSGGGHELACGANIKEHDFSELIERFKREILDLLNQ